MRQRFRHSEKRSDVGISRYNVCFAQQFGKWYQEIATSVFQTSSQ